MKDDVQGDLFSGLMNDSQSSELRNEIKIKVQPLEKELNLIRDRGLRDFVSLMLVNAEYIWTSPSTNVEDLYPPDEYLPGGLIKHIQRTVRAAFVLATAYPLSDEEIQILLAASILHVATLPLLPNDEDDSPIPDLYNDYYMISFDSFINDALEAELLSSRISKSALELDQETISRIVRLVHCCEGTFSPIEEIIPQDPLEILMASANIVAKSIHLIVDGSDVCGARWEIE